MFCSADVNYDSQYFPVFCEVMAFGFFVDQISLLEKMAFWRVVCLCEETRSTISFTRDCPSFNCLKCSRHILTHNYRRKEYFSINHLINTNFQGRT